MKPSKEELIYNLGKFTKSELMIKYKVKSYSTIWRWLKSYGLVNQRKEK
jgi:hypothetical protein